MQAAAASRPFCDFHLLQRDTRLRASHFFPEHFICPLSLPFFFLVSIY